MTNWEACPAVEPARKSSVELGYFKALVCLYPLYSKISRKERR